MIIGFMVLSVATISYITYRLLSSKIKHLRIKEEKRITELANDENGKLVLEQESKEREKQRNILPIINLVYFSCYSILLVIGIIGVYQFLLEIHTGSKINIIIIRNNGYYLFSPIIVIYASFELFQLIKRAKMKKF